MFKKSKRTKAERISKDGNEYALLVSEVKEYKNVPSTKVCMCECVCVYVCVREREERIRRTNAF